MNNPLILTINPGSTSTKFAVYRGKEVVFKETIKHKDEELMVYNSIADQLDYRAELLLSYLKKHDVDYNELNGVVGRGGFLRSLPSGTYLVDDLMLDDLKTAKLGEHASNLGALIAQKIASQVNIPAFIVDPIVVDEFEKEARISGIPDIERKSTFHALNIKAVSRKVADEIGKPYEELNFVVAHLGSGISVAAQRKGKVIDVNNANNEGPFSPERAGTLPAEQLARLCYSGKYTEKEMITRITKEGGLYAYCGTKNEMEVEERMEKGDITAKEILDAMIYQIAKEIGAMSTVLDGEVDGVILTGGLSYSDYIVENVSKKVKFVSPIYRVPGEEELEALAFGALRVLEGKEKAKNYKESVLV